MKYLRDPIWQFFGFVATVVLGLAALALANPGLVQRWWLPGLLITGALIALVALLRLSSWLRRAGAQLVLAANRALRLAKTEAIRLRAYHSGELEEFRSELETERDKYRSEKAKVDKLTLALTTLSDHVLRLFDRRVERPDELDWGGAMAASERTLRCARAALSHHITKVVYYDPDYPGSWVQGENAREARDYFARRFFVEKNAQELSSWVREALTSGLAHRSVIVFAHDVVPDTVAEVQNDTCLIRRYLDAGGRVVWRGDIPFWYRGRATGARDNWNHADKFECGPWRILGVYYANYSIRWHPPETGEQLIWDGGVSPEITPAGRDIGLRYPSEGMGMRPVPCGDIDLVYVLVPQRGFSVLDENVHGRDGDFALCWKKNFNEMYPHSGFMQYVPGDFVGREVNDDFFRFAVSGWPLLFDG